MEYQVPWKSNEIGLHSNFGPSYIEQEYMWTRKIFIKIKRENVEGQTFGPVLMRHHYEEVITKPHHLAGAAKK